MLFPHESLPIPEEEELPLGPLLNIFERKLAAPNPVADPNLFPTPDLTILVDGALVGSFSFGSYVAVALSKLATNLSLVFSSIKFCLFNKVTVSLIICSAFSTSAAPPY